MNIEGFGKSSISIINQFEKTIGFELPADYKQFLLSYNGGSDRMDEFYVPGLKEMIPTDVFFGLDYDVELDLRTWYNEYKGDLLPNTIIIAHDPGSGIIVLINGPDLKGVYYWDHACDFPLSDEQSNVYKIADSFQEFIDGLKVMESD